MRKTYALTCWLTLIAAAPALAQAPAAPPPGVVATTNNPNLSVASVKLDNGLRASKIIGTAVYGDGAERLGTIDDLVVTEGDKVTVAVIAVGGVLGMGSKLIAVPYSQIKAEHERLLLPGVTKDTLNAMPSLVY